MLFGKAHKHDSLQKTCQVYYFFHANIKHLFFRKYLATISKPSFALGRVRHGGHHAAAPPATGTEGPPEALGTRKEAVGDPRAAAMGFVSRFWNPKLIQFKIWTNILTTFLRVQNLLSTLDHTFCLGQQMVVFLRVQRPRWPDTSASRSLSWEERQEQVEPGLIPGIFTRLELGTFGPIKNQALDL